MLDWLLSETFLAGIISYAIPIIFAAYASLVSNKAGIAAINIEGAMSVSAMTGALVSYYTGSWLIGLVSAMAAGVLMMCILAFAALKLNVDSFLGGIALNTFANGVCLLVVKGLLDGRTDTSTAPSTVIPAVNIPLLRDIPVVGKAVFGQNLLFYILIIVLVLIIVLLKYTTLGVRIKIAGYNPEASRSVGISVKKTRTVALILCGALAGMGGAYLSMANLGYFSYGMVSGRGFIGIAAESMGLSMPGKTTLFAFLFGAVDYFAVGAQTVITFPYELLNIMPYLMTLIALVIYAVIHRKQEKRG